MIPVAVGVNHTDDLIWEVQDQVQRVDRMVSWLVSQAGGDPAVASRLSGEGPVKVTRRRRRFWWRVT